MRVTGLRALCPVAFCAGLLAGPLPALADTIPYPNVGQPNPVVYSFTAAQTGDVTGYFAGSGAAYSEDVGLLDNGVLTSAGFGLNDHSSSVGQSFDFGHVNAGDSLVFAIEILSAGNALVYSDPDLNTGYDINGSDGHNHVYSTAYTATSPDYPGIPVGTYVAFEDLPFPYSDFNYFDETYVFTDVNTTTNVPEPGSLALLAAGFLAVAVMRRLWRSRLVVRLP